MCHQWVKKCSDCSGTSRNSKMRGALKSNWEMTSEQFFLSFPTLSLFLCMCQLLWTLVTMELCSRAHRHSGERLFGASLLCWKITSALAASLQSHPQQHHIVPPSHSNGPRASYGSLSVPTHTWSRSWPTFLRCETGRSAISLNVWIFFPLFKLGKRFVNLSWLKVLLVPF